MIGVRPHELKQIGSGAPRFKEVPRGPHDGMEYTKFNMGFYDMERMNKVLVDVHNFLNEAELEPTWGKLKAACVSMKHSWQIFKWAYTAHMRKEYQKRMDRLEIAWKEVERTTPPGTTIPNDTIHLILDMLWSVLDGIYMAKQEVGLGIPKTRYSGAEARIKRALRA